MLTRNISTCLYDNAQKIDLFGLQNDFVKPHE